MRLVIVESPYAAQTEVGLGENIDYLRSCLFDCLERGEAPYASHAIYTDVLDDNYPTERKLGIDAGLAWKSVCDITVVYTDLGISPGMKLGIGAAEAQGNTIEYRSLPSWAKLNLR